MRLFWLAILIAPCAFGQSIQYCIPAGQNCRALDLALLPTAASFNARVLPCPTTKGWTWSVDGKPSNTENVCPIELGGDNVLTSFDDGIHVVEVTDGTTTYKAGFTVGAVPPPSGPMVDWSVSWTAPTQGLDGSALTCALTYEVGRGLLPDGPFSVAWTGSQTTATVAAASGQQCFNVSALCGTRESAPSNTVCQSKTVTPGSPPVPPVIVGGSPRALALVAGSSAGTRAVYARTSAGSRGAKVGDLTVGPVNGDFSRLECDVADAFTYGGNRYARVKTPLDGYVSGCYSVGLH